MGRNATAQNGSPQKVIETAVVEMYDEAPAKTRMLIVIPAYNEEESLGRVIRAIHEAVPDADIVVVNDGSADATAEVAAGHGATVINLPYNLGIGGTMQTGYIYAREHNYDIAIQVDGDGQHDPSEIPLLLEALEKESADVAIGSRFIEDKGYQAPLMRRTGIVILAGMLSLLTGRRVTDPTSGFRASNRRAIDFYADDYPFDYPEPEAIITLHRARLQVVEVPVRMSARLAGQSSITPLRSAYYMVKVIMSILINLLRQRPRVAGEVRRAA